MNQYSAERNYKPLLHQAVCFLIQGKVTLKLVALLDSLIRISWCGAHLNELCEEVDKAQVLIDFVLLNFEQALTTVNLLSYKLVE